MYKNNNQVKGAAQASSTSVPDVQCADFQTPSETTLIAQTFSRDIPSITKPPKLRSPDEDPPSKDEVPIEHWMYQVQSSQSLYSENVLKQGTIWSLYEDGARLVHYVGLGAQVKGILNNLETQFGQVASSDVLFQAFYQMAQDKNEQVYTFAAHLEGILNQLHIKFA